MNVPGMLFWRLPMGAAPKINCVFTPLTGTSGVDDQFDPVFHWLFVPPNQVCAAAGDADRNAKRQAAATRALGRGTIIEKNLGEWLGRDAVSFHPGERWRRSPVMIRRLPHASRGINPVTTTSRLS